MTDLFTPVTLGKVELANRIIMAPLTRCRATLEHVPTDLMVDYYSQRASAGLIIAEATMVAEGNSAFFHEPGIYSEEQITAWRKVTTAVHAKGGKIFLQLWHGGRACHPALNNGKVPVGPSAIAIQGEVRTPEGKMPYVVPKVLKDSDIADILEDFTKAAKNAKEAGFDGVEIHAANGYLIDQFLRDGSNKRDGEYGGDLENRARLLCEVLDEVINVWGRGHVGVRLSPINSFNSMQDSNPMGLLEYVLERISEYDLAYVHLMRADFEQKQQGDVMQVALDNFDGNLIGNMGYTFKEATVAVQKGQLEAVAFGMPFVANPDLVQRFANGLSLAQADSATLYTHEAKGYSDYPTA
ncbi:alkene reductase [Paraglaciecola sp. 25GB23A]|uniref:alkene reductase n=1 Tax=Paraglaciecola sp. 25GB23A TaxID=3156068 RepID=UPI0032AFBEDA